MGSERANITTVLGKIDGMWGDHLFEMLGPGETLVAGGTAALEGDNLASAFFCTNERVIQMAERMTGRKVDSLPLEMISSVDESTMLLGIVKVEVRGANTSFKATGRAMKGIAASINKARREQKKGEVSTASEAGEPMAQIEKLGELLNKGLINQEEFDEKKQAFLDRL